MWIPGLCSSQQSRKVHELGFHLVFFCFHFQVCSRHTGGKVHDKITVVTDLRLVQLDISVEIWTWILVSQSDVRLSSGWVFFSICSLFLFSFFFSPFFFFFWPVLRGILCNQKSKSQPCSVKRLTLCSPEDLLLCITSPAWGHPRTAAPWVFRKSLLTEKVLPTCNYWSSINAQNCNNGHFPLQCQWWALSCPTHQGHVWPSWHHGKILIPWVSFIPTFISYYFSSNPLIY